MRDNNLGILLPLHKLTVHSIVTVLVIHLIITIAGLTEVYGNGGYYSLLVDEPFGSQLNNDWSVVCGGMSNYDNKSWQLIDGVFVQKECDHVLRYAFIKDITLHDFTAEVDVKVFLSGNDGRVGIIFGLKDGNFCRQFFLFRICFESNTAQLRFHTCHGESLMWFDISKKHISKSLKLEEWYRLKIQVSDGNFQFYVDDYLIFNIEGDQHKFYFVSEQEKEIMEECSATEMSKGKVGIYCCEAISAFDNFSVRENTQMKVLKFGIENLKKELSCLSWAYMYEEGVFDCSEMSSALALYLRCRGWKTWIARKPGHAWVRVESNPGKYIDIEATTLSINWSSPEATNEYEVEAIIESRPSEYSISHIKPPLLRVNE